jgi:hypothetical protein
MHVPPPKIFFTGQDPAVAFRVDVADTRGTYPTIGAVHRNHKRS